MRKIIKFLTSVLICLGAGFIGSFFTTPNVTGWYETLQRPDFAPPNWLFAPVWTILFILMGISLFLVWNLPDKIKIRNWFLAIFVFNLLLNIFWSVLFFGWHQPLWAVGEIIILWLSILILIILGWRISKPASWLLWLYLVWVSFAAYLNYSFWQLNK